MGRDVYQMFIPLALQLLPSIIVGHPVPGIVVWSQNASEYFWEIT